MKVFVLFALFALFGTVACHADDEPLCPSGDESCTPDTDELSLLAVVKTKKTAHAKAHNATPDTSDDDEDDSEPVGTSHLPHEFLMQRSNRTLSKTELEARIMAGLARHFDKPEVARELLKTRQARGGMKATDMGILDLLESGTSSGTSCPIKYDDQWFKPRLAICGGGASTGIGSCTESGCFLFSSVFYDSHCHTVYYSNAMNQANGFGMCRCMPATTYEITRYTSSSGNSIMSCSSIVG